MPQIPRSPGPQSQLASPIPVVSFWSTHRSQPRHRKTKIKSEFKIANQWICPCPCLSPAEVRTLLTKNMGMWRMWRNVWMLLENSGHRSSLFFAMWWHMPSLYMQMCAKIKKITTTCQKSHIKLFRQETPNSVGGRKSMCQIQAHKVRHYRHCSSRTLFRPKKQRYV